MAALFKRRRWLGIVLVALAALVAYVDGDWNLNDVTRWR